MPDLKHAGELKAYLRQQGIHTSKRYGQNFLADPAVLDQIVDAAQVSGDDYVIEIGPGIGTLTRRLCMKAGFVTAVELDKKLLPILSEQLSDLSNVEVINQDILKTDIQALIGERKPGGTCKIVANLPYYITTPIIMKLLESRASIRSITVMVQKEVADRICSGPGSREYGSLSLAVQYYARPEIMFFVPPECFVPEPAVTSAVLNLALREEPAVSVRNEKLLFSLIHASFEQRRKTLANGLKNAAGLGLSKEMAASGLAMLGKPMNVRGEELSLSEFAKLADYFDNNIPLC
ncbi:MAG: 16S rRNA (adenine(1518)-N(6)/adenine(1519)-N(6))-dimethyltransferase RsmA [Lachnospiraceae bacterium]|nr:16S rRNA (adenine(1518)-N(6)/adenine(1519)-N(6))-dimethyltransferase RsmA [Lachnospiraceae bacterium]